MLSGGQVGALTIGREQAGSMVISHLSIGKHSIKLQEPRLYCVTPGKQHPMSTPLIQTPPSVMVLLLPLDERMLTVYRLLYSAFKSHAQHRTVLRAGMDMLRFKFPLLIRVNNI